MGSIAARSNPQRVMKPVEVDVFTAARERMPASLVLQGNTEMNASRSAWAARETDLALK